jgi:hypothetical protein
MLLPSRDGCCWLVSLLAVLLYWLAGTISCTIAPTVGPMLAACRSMGSVGWGLRPAPPRPTLPPRCAPWCGAKKAPWCTASLM